MCASGKAISIWASRILFRVERGHRGDISTLVRWALACDKGDGFMKVPKLPSVKT